jgi:lantibiotic modifying enzyme
MSQTCSIEEKRFQRIVNVLLLNASFIDNLGLMHGKMGIAIFFFHLARETQNQIYEDYAGELIDEIYDEISISTPLDFENGLAGIGWGIEYLAQKGFIEAETDEVLESIDNQMRPSLNQFKGIGLLNGLIGLGAYYLKRIQNSGSSADKDTTLMNKKMLVQLIEEMELRIENEGVMNLINGTETFNLTWDYPILLGFLAEVFQLNQINFKVERIFQQLIAPLLQSDNIPEEHSKQLQLALAFEKLNHAKLEESLASSSEKLIQKLLGNLERETIFSELASGSSFLQDGTSGIAWIYEQLFVLTNDEYLQKESRYWRTRSLEFDKTEQGYAGFYVDKGNENKAFGLLQGIAGINPISI